MYLQKICRNILNVQNHLEIEEKLEKCEIGRKTTLNCIKN